MPSSPARLRPCYFPFLLVLSWLLSGCREPSAKGSSSPAPQGGGSAGGGGAAGLQEIAGAAAGASGASPARELSWRFAEGPFGATEVVIAIPAAASGDRFPVLVAFHGREQTIHASRRGARAWLDDYRLAQTLERLARPPLLAGDLESPLTDERLVQLNAALRAEPYAGMIVVCPFLPDVLAGERAPQEGQALADFVVDRLLPRVYAHTPALGGPATTGVDGVSLGGRAALLVGLSRPLAFGSVGSLQAALAVDEVERFAELGARALQQNPALRLRLVTSSEDPFAAAHQALSHALTARAARHALLRLSHGRHDQAFTRGPGALEMLLFHDRVLRGQAPP